MVPIQLGVTTLPTEQVLEEMTSEINKGNEALGLSSPPSEPLPCPVESPNKPIEATLQPQQPLTGEGAAAAVQQSEISMAGSGCWPQKESDVEVKGPEKSVPEIVPSSSETSLVSNLTTSSTGTGTTETSTTTSTTTTTSGSTVTTTTTSSEQLEQPAVEQPQPPQEEHAGEDLQEHAAGNVNSTGGNDGSELAHPQDDRKEDVDKNENVAADDTEVGEEKADEEAPNAKQTLEVQSEAEPVQPVTKRAKTLADVQASAKASAKAKAKAKPKAAIKTNSRAAAKRPVQSDGHGSMNISEAMMKAAGAKKLKTGTGNGARK